MTLTFDVETWFKLIAQPLPKDTLYVKYKARLDQGERRYPGQVISDGQTENYKAPTERDIINAR